MADILHKLHINAPSYKVYEALTQQDGLSSWWTKFVTAVPEENAVLKFEFRKSNVEFMMRVEKLAPDFVKWYCCGENEEWMDTILEFKFSVQKEETDLSFAHRGWKTIDGIFAKCNYDWAMYLRSLKLYLETGKGEPYNEE